MTPLYAIHPPHTLAVASIFLTTRLLRIPLPDDWYILFDTTYEEMTHCAGTVMRLYHDWGVKAPPGHPASLLSAEEASTGSWEAGRKAREGRWRRAWIMAQSRKAVRRWIEENSQR